MRLFINHHGSHIIGFALVVVGVVLGGGAIRLQQSVRSMPVFPVQTIYLANDSKPLAAKPAINHAVPARQTKAAAPSAKTGSALDMVVVSSIPGKNDSASFPSKKQLSEEKEFGITIQDVRHIATCFENIADLAMVRDLRQNIPGMDGAAAVKLFAVMPSFLEVTRGMLKDNRGRWFSSVDMETRQHVCVLGTQAAARLFGLQDPVGKEVTISEIGFKVIGIIENSQGKKIGDALINDIALIPLDTANVAFGPRVVLATSTRWHKVYGRVDCDYLFIRVAVALQAENTVNRLRSYFQATHETEDYEIHDPQ